MTDDVLRQTSPWPTELEALVERLRYKAGWNFEVRRRYLRDPATTHRGESIGATLIITITTPNSYDPKTVIRVQHLFAIPPATYVSASWQRWLFDTIMLVERHEAAEFFTIFTPGWGELDYDDPLTFRKPFAPLHGPGEDPYRVVELASDEQRRTSFRGEVN